MNTVYDPRDLLQLSVFGNRARKGIMAMQDRSQRAMASVIRVLLDRDVPQITLHVSQITLHLARITTHLAVASLHVVEDTIAGSSFFLSYK